jgi:DNA-binding NarL/FixJ family response regulator
MVGACNLVRRTVLVADDHSIILERIRSLLTASFEVVGMVHNGVELISEAKRLQPDVIVSDITMPLVNGIEAAHELIQSGSTAKIVFLTVHGNSAFVESCFAEGALGYVRKERMGLDLIVAINEALLGHRFISPSLHPERPEDSV